MNMERMLLSFELNTYGELFLNCLFDNVDKNKQLSGFDRSVIVKYYNDEMTKFKYGIKITAGNKKTGCMLFKESFERNEILFDDAKFLIQVTNFTDNGNGKFAAAFGHDDLVMATIQFEFVKQTTQYRIMRNEFNETSNTNIQSNTYNINDFLSQLNGPQLYHQYPENQDMHLDPLTDTTINDPYKMEPINGLNRLNKFTNQNYG